MTCDELLYQTLIEVCPGTYLSYPTNGAPPLPWFAYSHQRDEEVFADNTNYVKLPRYRVELLFKEMDTELIESFEAALSSLGTWALRAADYLDTEGCLYHDYRLFLNKKPT